MWSVSEIINYIYYPAIAVGFLTICYLLIDPKPVIEKKRSDGLRHRKSMSMSKAHESGGMVHRKVRKVD
jgi:hypothetical protein